MVYSLWAYYFLKTYQFSGYDIGKFLGLAVRLDLAFGKKNRLMFTKRMCRYCVVLLVLAFWLFYLNYYFVSSVFLVIVNTAVTFLGLPIFMAIVHFVMLPFELLIKKYYIRKAKKKLAKKKKLIKIAVTGSYGKTSTKNILTSMLEKEYKVCSTPRNFNTEMGLTKTILNYLDDHDILVAEFGARHKGDIEILTKILEPDYAILTTIGNQHLETFKTLKNIEDTKNELPQHIKPDGIVVFNGDSKSTKKLYEKCLRQKFLACDSKGYAHADNIEISENGSKFDLHLDGKVIKVQTKLLGKCNINNIVTASVLANILGISDKDIASAIKTLEPTPHRLEMIKAGKFTILDDAYNSNLIGAKEGLEVLSKFHGRKIVITPGFVEMGKEQSQANFTLGGMIADVADYIIIMNELNKNEVFSGAISHNFDRKKIFFADTRVKQKEILQLLTCENCVILFENDLPDNYK